MTSVAVIGSGLFGIAAARRLRGRGLDVVWFSEDASPGGLWSPTSRATKVYPALFMITPHDDSVFAEDRPCIDDPDRFLHSSHYADYLRSAAPADGVRRQFGTRVESCLPTTGGGWRVRALGPEGPLEEKVDWVVNATGRSAVRRYPPSAPGGPRYLHLHAADYAQAPRTGGLRCLVIGAGPSGADIASDLAALGNTVDLSVRTPVWLVPKYVLGRPARLERSRSLAARALGPARRRMAGRIVRHLVGRQEAWGLPAPATGLLDSTPVPSDLLIHALRHRTVAVRPAVQRLERDDVVFSDGSRQQYDLVVSATGYDWDLPHLPTEVNQEAASSGLLLGMLPAAAASRTGTLLVVNGFRCKGAAAACAQIQADLAQRLVTGELTGPEGWRDPRPLAPEQADAGMTATGYVDHVAARLGRRVARSLAF